MHGLKPDTMIPILAKCSVGCTQVCIGSRSIVRMHISRSNNMFPSKKEIEIK